MGAGFRLPLKPLFRMIPGFSLTRTVRECATSIVPALAGPGRAVLRRCATARASILAAESVP